MQDKTVTDSRNDKLSDFSVTARSHAYKSYNSIQSARNHKESTM